MPHPAPPTTPIIYAVYWPASSTLKVGRANHMGRVRKHVKTGARVMVLIRDRPLTDERLMLNALERAFEHSFENWQESTHILGSGGSGYTECFWVPVDDVSAAVRLALGAFDRG